METGTVAAGAHGGWDLFGEALEQFHRAGACPPYVWHRDDGSTLAESIAFYFAPHAEWNAQERAAAAMADGPVLDVGCGAGKHALHFQDQRLAVTAIDLSPGAVRVCRARGVRDVFERSLFDLAVTAGAFRTVTLFTNNLSLGGTPEGVRAMLTALTPALAPGGRVVLTNLDVSSRPTDRDRAYHDANRRAGRLPGQIRMRAEFDGRTGPWIDWLFLSPAELAAVCADAGWHVDEVVNCGGPYAAALRR